MAGSTSPRRRVHHGRCQTSCRALDGEIVAPVDARGHKVHVGALAVAGDLTGGEKTPIKGRGWRGQTGDIVR